MASTLPDSIPFRTLAGDARRSYAATMRTTNNTSAPSEGVDPTVPIPRNGPHMPRDDQHVRQQRGTALENPKRWVRGSRPTRLNL